MQSGKFLYVDTDLKHRPARGARSSIDREQVADLGLDLASVGQELGTLLGGGYVNRFNFFDRSYKVIPQIGETDRATIGPLLDLKIKTPARPAHARVDLHPDRVEHRAAVARTGSTSRTRSGSIGGVQPGVTKEEGLRILEAAATQAGGPRHGRRLRG